jgi:uncharacterized protein (TIRG00374 family)
MPVRRRLWLALAAIVVVAALAGVFVDLPAVAAEVRRANGRLIAAAVAVLLLANMIYAQRWRWLLGSRVSWLAAFNSANIGLAVNCLIPLRAGEPARVVALSRSSGLPAGQVASSVVVERMIEEAMRLTALGGALAFGIGLPISPLTLFGGMAALAFAFGGILWLHRNPDAVLRRGPRLFARLPRMDEPRARQLLERLLLGLREAATTRRLILALAATLISWALYWTFYTLVLRALPADFSHGELLALSLGALALVPPSAPAAPGIYHAALVVPLSLLSSSPASITAFAVLAHAVVMSLFVVLGLWAFGSGAAPARELLAAENAEQARADQ